MQTATIVKDTHGLYHIRISSKAEPDIGGNVKLIEVLHQKPDENLEDFKERAIRFVKEAPPP